MTKINSLRDAVAYFVKTFCKGLNPQIINPVYGMYGPLAYIVLTNDSKIHYVMHKREWFNSFSYQFPQVKEKGIGQSFELELLHKANSKSLSVSYLVCVMQNGETYNVLSEDALAYVEENETTRTPKNETTLQASIPARMLQRMIEPAPIADGQQKLV